MIALDAISWSNIYRKVAWASYLNVENTEKNTEKFTEKFTEKNTEKFFCIFFYKIFCKFFCIFIHGRRLYVNMYILHTYLKFSFVTSFERGQWQTASMPFNQFLDIGSQGRQADDNIGQWGSIFLFRPSCKNKREINTDMS